MPVASSSVRPELLPPNGGTAPAHSDLWANYRAQLASWIGLQFSTVDRVTGEFTAEHETLHWLPEQAFDSLQAITDSATRITTESADVVALALSGTNAIAVSVIPHEGSEPSIEAIQAAAAQNWTSDELHHWWQERQRRDVSEVMRQLHLAGELIRHQTAAEQTETEVEVLADQVDSTYEEVNLLHFLAQNLQVSRDIEDLVGMCLTRLRESIGCRSACIWLLGDSGTSHFACDGPQLFDELQLALAIARFDQHGWPKALILNDVNQSLVVGTDRVSQLAIVPITQAGNRVGWIVAVDSLKRGEFGTVEASLMQSVALNLGTHLQNSAVVAEQEDLLLSFVRSLVSSLDAKDPYTRGHSERVAQIAQRLAIELGLDDQLVEDIYLAGLLHDIGKIGVNDAILSKPGKLTDEEFDEIKTHPVVGYQILSGIKKLAHILPGVRSHHESIDGRGYPDRLAGNQIPLMARVLAVADAYDAMGSDRPYRAGMPIDKLEGILADGRGQQWDAAIIDAYFACRDDIEQICLEWSARQIH